MRTLICISLMTAFIIAATSCTAHSPTKSKQLPAFADVDSAIDSYLSSITRNEREYQRVDAILGDTVLEGTTCDELTAAGDISAECKADLRSQVAMERAI